MELTKTYADGSTITKTYDVFGRLATETNARGMVKTQAYDAPTGQLIGIGFSDVDTPGQTFEYNVQGQLTQVTDAAGTRTLSYNEYGELSTDSLVAGGKTHLITENRDACGRSSGYTYAKAGSTQQTVSYAYGEDGRMASAGFRFGNADKLFTYGYLDGSNLLQTLTLPNGMSLTQEFETQRDLLTAMLYKRGTTGVVERHYTYDSLGRPRTRSESRKGSTRNDAFTHNDRSELTAATLGNAAYSYAYDNIGNRKTAQENAEEATAYTANKAGDGVSPISRTAGAPGGRGRVRRDRGNLNQYTAVGEFAPEFDADGKAADGCKADWTHAQRVPRRGEGAMGRARINQTKVQTSTGIWNVTYNAENRPTVFSRENEDGTTTQVTCAYDYMGRRATKKVETITTNAETEESTASTTLNQRYLYRGYLQVACCDLTRSAHPCLWLITWDPTQQTATRPLAIQKDATWYVYGWDLTKNICEVFGSDGYIKTVYSYAPHGAVAASGTVTQPIQWSSEFYDDELGLVYYNYRHYIPGAGRWLSRDSITPPKVKNAYSELHAPIHEVDHLGNITITECQSIVTKLLTPNQKLDKNIRWLTESLRKNGCRVPRTSCVPCVRIGGKVYGGGYNYVNNTIEIAATSNMIDSSVFIILQHELVHAWQVCNKGYPTTCVDVIRRELAAYREDGRCGNYVRWGISPSIRECMIEGAAQSGSVFCGGENSARAEARRQLGNVSPDIYPNLA